MSERSEVRRHEAEQHSRVPSQTITPARSPQDAAASPAFTKMLLAPCSLSLPPSLLPLLGLFCKEDPTRSPPVTPHPPSGSSAAVLLSPALRPRGNTRESHGVNAGPQRDFTGRSSELSLSICRGGLPVDRENRMHTGRGTEGSPRLCGRVLWPSGKAGDATRRAGRAL